VESVGLFLVALTVMLCGESLHANRALESHGVDLLGCQHKMLNNSELRRYYVED
jgi:hypothetical protein